MAVEAVREKKSILYGIMRVLAFLAIHLFTPVRYHGKEKLRDLDGTVLISNHVHALDPMILAWPVRKQCVFLGKKELGSGRFTRWFLNSMNCILVDRHNTDMQAMRSCMKALRMGRPLVMFPEGTRKHEGQMEHIENGASLIVLRGNVPLIPVYLDRPLKLFRRVNAWVGDPIDYRDLAEKGANAETCGALNERMRETFRTMIAGAEKNI